MSIDTRQKRMNMLSVASPFGWSPHFEADGTVDADDRGHLLHVYSGNSFAALSLKVTCSLVSVNGSSLPNLTLLSWAWFDQTDPNLFAAPVDQGEAEATSASGVIDISLPSTTLGEGEFGVLVLRSNDGVSLGAYEMATESV